MARRPPNFKIDSRQIEVNLAKLNPAMNRAITAAVDYQASRSEFFAKTNARWTDRTSAARNGLFAATQHNGNHHSMIISHLVTYGIWLEIAFSGRYAIIRQTLEFAIREFSKLLPKLLANAKRL